VPEEIAMTPAILQNPTCPMFQDTDCRFLSMETSRHPYTLLKKVNGIFAPDHQGVAIHELGAWCNNDGTHWVRDLRACPARWALTSFQNGKRAEGCGVYPDDVGQGMIVIDEEQRGVVVLGQQVLQID
jgi:hypothetical protein